MTSGSIVAGTLAVIRREWRAVLAWAAVSLPLGLAFFAALDPVSQSMFEGGPTPSGWLLALSDLLLTLASVSLYTAGYRAALLPGERHAAFLRIGMDEVRVLVVSLILYVGLLLAMVPLTFVASMVAVGLVWGGLPANVVGMALVGVILLILGWAGTRLSLCLPLTVLRRRIVLGAGWRLTKGRVLPLFGAYLVGGVAILLLWLILFYPVIVEILSKVGDLTTPDAAARITAIAIETLAPPFDASKLALQLAWALLGGLMVAVLGGMPGVATAQLLAEREEDGDEFRA